MSTVAQIDTVPVCAVDDCDRIGRMTRGMCDMHYQRWWKNGTTSLQPRPPRCSVDGCQKPAKVGPLCLRHYERKLRSGTTHPRDTWVNPLVCVCPAPDADPSRNFGMCQRCKRKPLALMAVAS